WESRQDPTYLVINPFAVESVQLWRTPEGSRLGLWDRHAHETVCQFRPAADTDTTRFDLRPPYEAEHYAVTVALTTDLALDGTADVTMLAERRPRRWFTFDMESGFVVDSVSAGGSPVAFDVNKEYGRIWVHVEPPVPAGETRVFRFRYHGEPFEREENRI